MMDTFKETLEQIGKKAVVLYLVLAGFLSAFIVLQIFNSDKYGGNGTYIALLGSMQSIKIIMLECILIMGILILGIYVFTKLHVLVKTESSMLKIPADILALGLVYVKTDILDLLIYGLLFATLGNDYAGWSLSSEIVGLIVSTIVVYPLVVVWLYFFCVFLKQGRERLWWKNSLLKKGWEVVKKKYIKRVNRNKKIKDIEGLKKSKRVKVCILLIVLAQFFGIVFVADEAWGFLYDDFTVLFISLYVVTYVMELCLLWKYLRLGRDTVDIFMQIQKLGSGTETVENPLSEKSEYYPIAEQVCDVKKRIEESAREQIKSERMKMDLLTNVSHDLKTPLTSIISYVDLLSKMDLEEEAKDYVEIIKQKSGRLEVMVQNVFEIAKATSGNAELEMEKLEMNRLVEQTLADMEDAVTESGFQIKKDMTTEENIFMGDSGKLYRVCQNLIENALKYSLQGSRIYVETKKEAEKVLLEIVNTASYEMEFDEETIVERFARGDASRTTEGNGLGLNIAKSFTEACGGEFSVRIDRDQFRVVLAFPLVH